MPSQKGTVTYAVLMVNGDYAVTNYLCPTTAKATAKGGSQYFSFLYLGTKTGAHRSHYLSLSLLEWRTLRGPLLPLPLSGTGLSSPMLH